MNSFFKFRFFGLTVCCFVIFFCSGIGAAQSVPQVEKKRAAINERIEFLSDSYGDVPPSYSCQKPKLAYERLICASKDLQLLEKLYRMAAVYGYENATKAETNHKTYINSNFGVKLRARLKTEQSVIDFFIKQIDDALGGESPFYEAP